MGKGNIVTLDSLVECAERQAALQRALDVENNFLSLSFVKGV